MSLSTEGWRLACRKWANGGYWNQVHACQVETRRGLTCDGSLTTFLNGKSDQNQANEARAVTGATCKVIAWMSARDPERTSPPPDRSSARISTASKSLNEAALDLRQSIDHLFARTDSY